MLYRIGSQGPELITRIPHAGDYRRWISRLTTAEIRAIDSEFDRRIAAKKNPEVVTSSWLPGQDWTNTPFQAIYENATRYDEIAAAKCFGLMLWEFFMEHPEAWSFGHYELNEVPIEGLTYFRIDV